MAYTVTHWSENPDVLSISKIKLYFPRFLQCSLWKVRSASEILSYLGKTANVRIEHSTARPVIGDQNSATSSDVQILLKLYAKVNDFSCNYIT